MILAIVGMEAEARIARRAGMRAAVGGRDLDERALGGTTGVLSFGLCGALAPDLRVGDLVIARAVVAGEERWSVDEAWRTRLAAALPAARGAVIVGMETIAATAAQKAALRQASAADVVDLESHLAARLARRHALPFAALRAVSDAAHRSLPTSALAGLRADGRSDPSAVLVRLLRRPRELPALVRAAWEAGQALAALRRAVVRVPGPV
ncbi:MAG: phosphorylase family protein [Caulobacteraceae bacterium]